MNINRYLSTMQNGQPLTFYFPKPLPGFMISRDYLSSALFCTLREHSVNEKKEAAVSPAADWALIAKLQWRMLSDGPIESLERLRYRISHEMGGNQRVKNAIERRAVVLMNIPGCQTNLAWQAVALGQDIVNAIVDSPPFMEFIEKEMQPIDIIEVLA